MHNEMRFLLDLGVDGFRVDMVTHIGKNPDLLDEPLNPSFDSKSDDPNDVVLRKYRNSDPTLYAYMREMVEVLNEYEGRFMVTEDYVARDDPVARYMDYYSVDPKRCAPFSFENFDFMMPRKAGNYKAFYDKYLGAMGPDFVPTTVLGNHDNPRIASSLGAVAARAAAVMQLTLPGQAYIYYGEELGMENVEIPPHMIDDPHDGRDPERTPMQWTSGKNAGFSDAEETWLPVSPDYSTRNVEAQLQDPHSFLSLYRRLLKMRRESMALRRGLYVPQESESEEVFGFMRQHQDERLITAINFSGEEAGVKLRGSRLLGSIVLSSIYEMQQERTVNLTGFGLRPNEAVVISH